MTKRCWIRLAPRGEFAAVHICNKSKHRDYTVKGMRYKWLVDWIRDNSTDIAPWFEGGDLILEANL